MYRVYINGCRDANLMHDVSKGIVLEDPVLTLNDGEPDEFTFTIYPDNPQYSQIIPWLARITVDEDDNGTIEGRFRGRIISVKTDMYGRRSVVCEGALGYLDDASFYSLGVGTLVSSTYAVELSDALTALNTYLGDSSRVVTTNISLRMTKRYWDAGKDMDWSLLDWMKRWASDNGYHLWAAYRSASYELQGGDDLVYIRLLADDSLPASEQGVSYGVNMISCNVTETIRDSFLTRVHPLGQETNGYRIDAPDIDTTNTVRGDTQTSMINRFGILERGVVFDSASDTNALTARGTTYVNRYAKEGYEIDVRAVDSHYIDSSVTKFRMRTQVPVSHPALGISETVPVKQMVLHLSNPEKNEVRLSKTGSRRLTDQIREVRPL